jgi:hypothetical protein
VLAFTPHGQAFSTISAQARLYLPLPPLFSASWYDIFGSFRHTPSEKMVGLRHFRPFLSYHESGAIVNQNQRYGFMTKCGRWRVFDVTVEDSGRGLAASDADFLIVRLAEREVSIKNPTEVLSTAPFQYQVTRNLLNF